MPKKTTGNPKSPTSVRVSALTKRQIKELYEQHGLNQPETITLAVDRLHRQLMQSSNENVTDAVAHLTSIVHRLEETSFADWPQWSAADLEAVERVIAEFGKRPAT